MCRQLLVLSAVLWFAGANAAETTRFDQPGDLAGWVAESGSWSIADGALLQADSSASRTITRQPGSAYGDVDVTVEFFIFPEGDGVKAPGLVYRALDQESYYYIHFDLKNAQVVWVRSAAGKEWTDARRHKVTGLKAGAWQTARVVCAGALHQVYRDGQLLFSETDDTLTGGVTALRTGQGRMAFRNLRLAGTPFALAAPFRVRVAPYSVVCADAGAGGYEAFPDVCRTTSGELLCYDPKSVPAGRADGRAGAGQGTLKSQGRTT